MEKVYKICDNVSYDIIDGEFYRGDCNCYKPAGESGVYVICDNDILPDLIICDNSVNNVGILELNITGETDFTYTGNNISEYSPVIANNIAQSKHSSQTIDITIGSVLTITINYFYDTLYCIDQGDEGEEYQVNCRTGSCECPDGSYLYGINTSSIPGKPQMIPLDNNNKIECIVIENKTDFISQNAPKKLILKNNTLFGVIFNKTNNEDIFINKGSINKDVEIDVKSGDVILNSINSFEDERKFNVSGKRILIRNSDIEYIYLTQNDEVNNMYITIVNSNIKKMFISGNNVEVVIDKDVEFKNADKNINLIDLSVINENDYYFNGNVKVIVEKTEIIENNIQKKLGELDDY